MTSNLLQAALDLAEAGWRVLPCIPTGPKTKAPLLPAPGHHLASQDPEQIGAWWRRWPTAMIGAPIPATLLVLDIDPRNGGSYEALIDEVGPLPETLTAWSGRGDGGRHLYFLRPYGRLRAQRLPAGIDFKISGYLIMPPSRHPATGRPYEWEHHAISALPPAAVNALRPPVQLREPSPVAVSSAGKARQADALVRTVSDARPGRRNDLLLWAARRAFEAGHDDTVLARIADAADAAGLGDIEIGRTIESARAYCSARNS